MNEIVKVFENEEFGSVRTVSVDGEPWFVGKDVVNILGYQNGSRDINRHVDEEDRVKTMVFDGNQMKETIVINESGLYSLILSSKLEKAKEFKRWVTSEILPSIRKHGLYAIDELVNNPDLAIKAFAALRDERQMRQKLEKQNAVQAQQIAEYKPKVTYCDMVLKSKSLINVSTIAQDYGMTANKFNLLLQELGIQYKRSKSKRCPWCLYSKYIGKGYTDIETYHKEADGMHFTSESMKWTQKGRLFLYDKLKEHDILPVIEQE